MKLWFQSCPVVLRIAHCVAPRARMVPGDGEFEVDVGVLGIGNEIACRRQEMHELSRPEDPRAWRSGFRDQGSGFVAPSIAGGGAARTALALFEPVPVAGPV